VHLYGCWRDTILHTGRAKASNASWLTILSCSALALLLVSLLVLVAAPLVLVVASAVVSLAVLVLLLATNVVVPIISLATVKPRP